MKYGKFFLLALMMTMTTGASAQGFKVYLKSGSVLDFPASEVAKIEFYPAETKPDDPDNPDNPKADEDKDFLEKTGIALLNEIDADDFRNISETLVHIDDIDEGELDSWYDNCLESVKTALGSHTESESSGWGSYLYHYTDYKWLLRASTFTGHFKEQGGRWVKESDASDLQFTFTDQKGNTCVARVTTSGSTKTLHIVDSEEYQDYYNSTEYIDNNKIYADVPEHMTATLQRAGSTLVTVNVDIDLSTITGEEWDLTRNGITATVSVQANNYHLQVSRAGYQPGTGASVALSLSKGDTSLLTASVTAAGTIDISSDILNDEQEFSTDDLGAANAVMDILGRVQVKGQISNVGKLVRAIDNANENDDRESDFKRYVNNANNLMTNNFFYNNGTTSRGTITLEAFVEEEWNGQEYWDMRPIITFASDGSSYAFDSYFTESSFQSLVDTYKNLLDDFDYMLQSTDAR